MPNELEKREAARLFIAMQGFSRDADQVFAQLSEALYQAGQAVAESYAAGFQEPTRWQRFCYRFRQFWLERRYF